MTPTLSAAAREALLSVPDETDHRLIKANGNVLRGLERRGLCTDIMAFRDGTFARLTDDGCIAVASISAGE